MGFIVTLIYVALVYLSIGDMFPAFASYRVNLILSILAVLVSIPTLLARQDYFRLVEFRLMVGFLGAIFLSLLMVGWLGGMLLALTKVMPAMIVFYLFAANCTSPLRVRIVMYVIIAVTSYLIFRGSSAYHAGILPSPWLHEQKFWEGPNYTGNIITLIRVRALGILNDPNDFAQMIVLSVPMLWLNWKKGYWPTNLLFVILPLGWLCYGLYLTRSRGSIVGLITIVAILLYNRFGKIASALGPVLFVMGLLALGFSGGRAISISSGRDRIMLWSDGLGMLIHSPIWGISWGGYTDYSAQTAHNSFVLCFAELGLIGLFFFIGVILLSVLRLQKLSTSPEVDPDFRKTATILKYVLYGFITSSWFLSRTYEMTLYLLLGLTAGLELRYREDLLYAKKEIPPDPKWVKPTLIAMVACVVSVYLSIKLS